jgi:hypothetical protein
MTKFEILKDAAALVGITVGVIAPIAIYGYLILGVILRLPH